MTNRNGIIGIILIVLGALSLLFRNVDVASFGWPIFIVLPGVLMLGWAFLGDKDVSGLAVPGCIVTTVGLILFIQNATNTFESWSYTWALVMASAGVGIFLKGSLDNDSAGQRDGTRLASLGLGLFAVFGIFFEFFIFDNFGDGALGGYLLPLLLIAGGVYLLSRRDKNREPSGG